jgi:predicted Rossmann fold flavoprotein
VNRHVSSLQIALVEKHGIAYHEKTAGQLFCDGSSRDILSMLEAECSAGGVRIVTHCSIAEVTDDEGYTVITDQGTFRAPSLVIATGGLSIPKMGASDFGYRLAKQFGLGTTETRAGLVPFTFSGPMHELTGRLSGLSVPATISVANVSFTENILFTHRGLSGPAALQASSYWLPGNDLEIDLLPAAEAGELLRQAKSTQPKALLRTVLAEYLPRALVLELQQLFWREMADRPVGELADALLNGIAKQLHRWVIRPAATEGYRTAEVTLGGIDTAELSSKTMECRRKPGLFCIGEVVDVTGHLGGFNFQWAWASAHAAGQAV